jgi:PTS system fructose-specific IIC component
MILYKSYKRSNIPSMICFQKILSPACIRIGFDAADKNAALEAAVETLARGGKVSNVSDVLSGILIREALAPTCIGGGIAIPHTLCTAAPEMTLGILRLAHPIPFNAPDDKPVDIIFIIAGPKGSAAEHLKLLSKLTGLLHEEAFCEALRNAPEEQSLAQLFYGKDP